MKIITIGEILWDIFENVEHLGGAAFNFAARARRLAMKCSLSVPLALMHAGSAPWIESKSLGFRQSLSAASPVSPQVSQPSSFIRQVGLNSQSTDIVAAKGGRSA